MNRYWSKSLHGISPYVAGEQPRDGSYIKLNTNENPWPPSAAVTERIREAATNGLQLYPDPECGRLRQALADHFRLSTDSIFAGNGSDEVLAHAFKAFFQQDLPVCFPDISYSFYPVFCQHLGIDFEPVPVTDDLAINLDAYPGNNGGIIFANPNAPTGLYLPVKTIRSLLERNRDSVVIVDEAYVDFASESAVSLVRDFENLLVVQTLSKSRSLAGVRVGYAMGHPGLVSALTRVKDSFNSYPLGTLSMTAAIAAIEDSDYFNECRDKIIEIRTWTESRLQELGFTVLPSQANFLLVTHSRMSGAAYYHALKDRGVLVRHFDNERISDYVRITIGVSEDMHELINASRAILEDQQA